MSNLYLNAYRILRPRHWSKIYPYDEEWDEVLNELLDYFRPARSVSPNHTVMLGNVEVWISNYPYAFGYPYAPVRREVLPSAWTQDRLRASVGKWAQDSIRIALHDASAIRRRPVA